MAKKSLVVLCDGTWNELSDANRPVTNVVKLAQVLEANRADGAEQIVYYDDGVGVGADAVAGRIESMIGGAFGAGLLRNIEEAYRFIIFNYSPGDDIFIFGFSRGAFTARSLAGMLSKIGIIRHTEAHRIHQVFEHYKSKRSKSDPVLRQFRRELGYGEVYVDPDDYPENHQQMQALAVRYMGIWDTVGSMGLPKFGPADPDTLPSKYRFHDLKLSSFVKSARHAIGLNEDRKAFLATRWNNLKLLGASDDYQQLWFPGDHGSIGGGGDVTGLSDGALDWVAQGAERAGLKLNRQDWALQPDHTAPLSNYSDALRKRLRKSIASRMVGLFMDNLPSQKRHIADLGVEDLSDSALSRWLEDGPFRKGLDKRGLKLTEQHVRQEGAARGLPGF